MVRQVLRLWALSLMVSVVIAAAAERWPQTLVPDPRVVAALVLVPPLMVLIWLGFNWRLGGSAGEGSGDGGESQHTDVMDP